MKAFKKLENLRLGELMMLYYDALKKLFFNIVLITASLLYPIFSMAESSKSRSSVEALVDLSIEQLMAIEVSSTTFFDTPPEKAPGSIYLISQEKMENSYSSSISDFLEYYVPGVNISRAYSAGSLYSARGIASPSNSTTLFMVNGTNMNVSSGTGINTNLNLPLLGDLERIEVLKGPCSIIHGSGSINGFINVIQKNGRDNQGGFINTEAGLNDGLIKTETGYGVSSSEYGDAFIYAGAVKSDGISESGNSNAANQSTINDNYFPTINSRFSLNWERDNFHLFTFFQNEEVESTLPWRPVTKNQTTQPTTSSDSSGTVDNQTTEPSNNIYYQPFSNKHVGMKTMAILPQLNLDLTDTEKLTIELPIQYFEYDPAYFSSETFDLDSEIQLKSNLIFKTTRFSNHRVAFGGSTCFKQFESDRVSIYLPSIATENGDFMVDTKAELKWFEASLFFEDNYQLTKDLTLLAGLRYDTNYDSSNSFKNVEGFTVSGDGGQAMYIPPDSLDLSVDGGFGYALIPRLGITYDIDEHKIIKFVYQEGYHNSDYITIMKYLNSFSGGAPIVSEEVESYELSYHQDFMNRKFQFNLNIYSNIFDNTIFILMDQDEDGFVDSQITDEFISSGFEASLTYNPVSDTTMEVSYSFSQPCNMKDDTEVNPHLVDKTGDLWKAFPEHTVKMNITKSFMNEKLDISLGAIFNNATDTVGESSSQANANTQEQTDQISEEQQNLTAELENPLPDQNSKSPTDLFNHDRFVFNIGARYHLTKNFSLIVKGENIFDNDVPAAGYYYNLQNSENISLENPTYYIGLNWKF
ncbi:MAG: TonB-dependent receptor [Desulfamplus sp.]|nr:TonB-dependent receptor [Desulfamplus sp.]